MNKILKKIPIWFFLFTPLIALFIIRFQSNLWRNLYQHDSLNLILLQMQNYFESDPLPMIALMGAGFGIITLYYGGLLKGENRYLKTSESIEFRLKGITFFAFIPSVLLLGHLISNIDKIFYLENSLKLCFFVLLILQQLFIFKDFFLKINNHYKYQNLVKIIKNPIPKIPTLKTIDQWTDKESVMLHMLYVLIIAYILLKTDISFILIILLFWLIFVTTTVLAVYASLVEARYFIVDINLDTGDEFKEAVLIREEKGDFIRIIPKPEESTEQQDKNNYTGIILNRNHITKISYH